MSKSDSMLSILWILNARGRMTAKQIAEELEINIRTVYRYIDALCMSGVPIISESGHNGGYSLPRNFIKAPLILDIDEKKALLQSAVFAKESGYPYDYALDSATSKLRMYTNEEQANKLNQHLRGFDIIGTVPNADLISIIEKLDVSVVNKHTILIEYNKGNGEENEVRQIDPYGIVYWNSKWYIVGYCHIRGEIRIFRIDRIKKVSQLEFTFQTPVNFSSRDFLQKSIIPNTLDKKMLITVKIQGSPHSINDLCNHWLLAYLLIQRSESSIAFWGDSNFIFNCMPYYLLSYGKTIEILEPLELKERIVEIASDLMRYYQK